jgi:hypothetical protein
LVVDILGMPHADPNQVFALDALHSPMFANEAKQLNLLVLWQVMNEPLGDVKHENSITRFQLNSKAIDGLSHASNLR